MRIILAYVAAVTVTFVLASIAHTQMVLNELAALGAPVTLPLRFSESISDMAGFVADGPILGLFPLIVAIALLVALPMAGLVARVAPGLRTLVFMVAGAVAMIAVFAALEVAVGTRAVFGARGAAGLGLQALSGAIGGLLFASMKPRAE